MNSDNSHVKIRIQYYTGGNKGKVFYASRSNIWEAMNILDLFAFVLPCYMKGARPCTS